MSGNPTGLTPVPRFGKPEPAINYLLAGLIDYAGLFPPASLDMRSAVRNYLHYRRGPHAAALGRFIVSLDRVDELRSAAGASISEIGLSVIVPPDVDLNTLHDVLGDDFARAALEFKVDHPEEIRRIGAHLQAHPDLYFEVPIACNEAFLDAIGSTGARAKLRMGGVVAQAFPSSKTVASLLWGLAARHIPFKATAGLHHPLRSCHPFTDKPASPAGTMHGFVNLACAAVLLHHGGTASEACHVLEEESPEAWRVAPGGITCRGFVCRFPQLIYTRKNFFISFGSCSFEEPIRDLEALGWL